MRIIRILLAVANLGVGALTVPAAAHETTQGGSGYAQDGAAVAGAGPR
jgi:hypothetical protein